MDRQILQEKLWRYRSDQARAEYLRRYIPLMEKRLEEMKEDALRDIGAAQPPDAVRGASGPGNPTAVLGIRAAEYALSDEIRDFRDRLNGLRRECAALETQNALTECLLSSLPDEGRFLLTCRYVEHVGWEALARRYEERYHVDYSPLTLRRRIRRTLDEMCGTAESGETETVKE